MKKRQVTAIILIIVIIIISVYFTYPNNIRELKFPINKTISNIPIQFNTDATAEFSLNDSENNKINIIIESCKEREENDWCSSNLIRRFTLIDTNENVNLCCDYGKCGIKCFKFYGIVIDEIEDKLNRTNYSFYSESKSYVVNKITIETQKR